MATLITGATIKQEQKEQILSLKKKRERET